MSDRDTQDQEEQELQALMEAEAAGKLPEKSRREIREAPVVADAFNPHSAAKVREKAEGTGRLKNESAEKYLLRVAGIVKSLPETPRQAAERAKGPGPNETEFQFERRIDSLAKVK